MVTPQISSLGVAGQLEVGQLGSGLGVIQEPITPSSCAIGVVFTPVQDVPYNESLDTPEPHEGLLLGRNCNVFGTVLRRDRRGGHGVPNNQWGWLLQ